MLNWQIALRGEIAARTLTDRRPKKQPFVPGYFHYCPLWPPQFIHSPESPSWSSAATAAAAAATAADLAMAAAKSTIWMEVINGVVEKIVAPFYSTQVLTFHPK